MQEMQTDGSSIPRSGRSAGGGHGNPLQYCLENPMDRGARWATVHAVTESDMTETKCTHITIYKIDKQQGPTV